MGGQKSLIYAFVARGTVILAEYTEFSGNFNSIAFQCLQKLPATNNKFTYNCDAHTFNYLVDNGYTYCVVADESAGRQVPIAFLERVKDDFVAKYGGGKAATAAANSLNKEFGSKLKEHMQYCVDHPEEISKLAKVKAQVSEVKGVMMENIEKVLDRGEKIELLVDKTETLHHQVRHDSESPVRDHVSPRRRSPSRKSQSRTERSPPRQRKSHRDSSPPKEKHSSRAKSPKHARSPSPPPRSPSPRTKRLRRSEAGRAEVGKVSGKEHERINDRRIGRDLQEGGTERDGGSDRKEKVSGRNDGDDKSSRSRRGTSPSDRHRRSRHRSRSPQHGDTRDGEKASEGRGRNQSRGTDKNMHREKGSDGENETERMERRTTKDSTGHRSSRSRHEQSTSPSNGHHRNRHRTHSPQQAADTRARDEVPESREAEDGLDENDSVAMMKAAEEALEAQKKQKPSFELSGKLAAETNRFRGITLLYNEPAEARPPNVKWRLYVFKGGEVLDEPLNIHRQSCYLFGRERRVADVPTDHLSCSKQHAVIQFRQVEKEQPVGTLSKEIKPYIMDLGSTNKTFVNESAIEPQRYYELMERDTIKFGKRH